MSRKGRKEKTKEGETIKEKTKDIEGKNGKEMRGNDLREAKRERKREERGDERVKRGEKNDDSDRNVVSISAEVEKKDV